MENLEFIRFKANGNGPLTDQVINCYRNVFGGEPWNEWKRCQKCDRKFGIEQLADGKTHCCNMPLVDFWPKEVVQRDIFNEISGDASCWLSVVKENDNVVDVVGFSWGYPITPKNLEDMVKFSGIVDIITDIFGHMECVAYQDEIGLATKYRGQKIGRAMQLLTHQDYTKQGLGVVVARTKTNPPTVAYHWYKKAGMDVIGEYGDEDGRVIMAGRTNNLSF